MTGPDGQIEWTETIEEIMRAEEDPDSHRELDPWTFHPSQVGNCKRQCYLSKLGLDTMNAVSLANVKIGTLVHEWLEERMPELRDDVVMEVPIETTIDGIDFVGHSDCVQFTDEGQIVYDFKTKGSFYKYNGPRSSHLDQAQVYMNALEANQGQIVYLSKKRLFNTDRDEEQHWSQTDRYWIETAPKNGLMHVDRGRLREATDRAREVAEAIERDGLPSGPSDIPFDRCGCWICDHEIVDEDRFF